MGTTPSTTYATLLLSSGDRYYNPVSATTGSKRIWASLLTKTRQSSGTASSGVVHSSPQLLEMTWRSRYPMMVYSVT